MTNSDLVRLNEQQQQRGEPPYANTRNVTAGSIRLLDPRVCAERRLHLFCHGVGLCRRCPLDHAHAVSRRNAWLWVTRDPPRQLLCRHFDDAIGYCDHVIDQLHELDFEVDGLVHQGQSL